MSDKSTMSDKSQQTEPKPASQSLTVKAALGKAFIPVITFFVMKHLEFDAETAALVAGGIFAALSGLADYGIRRATGGGLGAKQ